MIIREFSLERFFAKHEFSARHVLGASDVDGMRMAELLSLADPECERLWGDLRLGYTESAGHPLLRAQIAALYPGLSDTDILTFSGAEEGIFLTMHATLQAGDHMVVVWPAYQSLHEVARSIGAEITAVPLDPRDWSLDLNRLRDALRPNTKLLIINFPNSPTGAHIGEPALHAIVEMCVDRGIRLFSDEVYRLLEHDRADTLPAAATLHEGAVSLGVLSKAYGLAGLRVGWIATRDAALRARIAALKDYTTICGAAPSEILGLIALRAGDRVVGRCRSILAGNLPILTAFMERLSGVLAWVPPTAGSVCFPRFAGAVDAERAAEVLIARVGVVVVPGARFDFDRSYFRVGYGRADMVTALDLIEPILLGY